MKSSRPPWDFDYAPLRHGEVDDDGAGPLDVIVALRRRVDPGAIRLAIRRVVKSPVVTVLLDRAPLHWFRVRAEGKATRASIARALASAGLVVRYVASARCESMLVPPALRFRAKHHARGDGWLARRGPAHAPRAEGTFDGDGDWFLRDGGGVAVDREACGGGAGTRLAVVDDDAADAELLDLDAVVPVGIERVPTSHSHGSLMVAWATGARRDATGTPFHGVAPFASSRLYVIAKPGVDLVGLPLAIARATFDGADVLLCATYVEGTTSPLLDDALEVAAVLGRRGRGMPIVFPTGRETSSPPDSLHASLTLSLGDPASDPRVTCIAPGGRDGAWFLWKDRRGKVRPFANRGPAVRFVAPGDDVTYPFSVRPRLFHAESSGAAAIAAGVLLLVIGTHPELRAMELEGLLRRTVAEPSASSTPEGQLADRADVLPKGRDKDGHDAKHGYGRLDATRACLAASGPIALALATTGDVEAAAAVARGFATSRLCTPRFARFAVRAALHDASFDHALRALARHLRLVARDGRRASGHPEGALVRHIALALRMLRRSPLVASAPALIRKELASLAARVLRISAKGRAAAFEGAVVAALTNSPEDHDPSARSSGTTRVAPLRRVS